MITSVVLQQRGGVVVFVAGGCFSWLRSTLPLSVRWCVRGRVPNVPEARVVTPLARLAKTVFHCRFDRVDHDERRFRFRPEPTRRSTYKQSVA